MASKFWRFAYDQYYPSGGVGDLQEIHDTLEEAQNRANVRVLGDKREYSRDFDYERIYEIENNQIKRCWDYNDGMWEEDERCI